MKLIILVLTILLLAGCESSVNHSEKCLNQGYRVVYTGSSHHCSHTGKTTTCSTSYHYECQMYSGYVTDSWDGGNPG